MLRQHFLYFRFDVGLMTSAAVKTKKKKEHMFFIITWVVQIKGNEVRTHACKSEKSLVGQLSIDRSISIISRLSSDQQTRI